MTGQKGRSGGTRTGAGRPRVRTLLRHGDYASIYLHPGGVIPVGEWLDGVVDVGSDVGINLGNGSRLVIEVSTPPPARMRVMQKAGLRK